MRNLSAILVVIVLINLFPACRSTKKLEKAVTKKDTTVTHVVNDKPEIKPADNSKVVLANIA